MKNSNAVGILVCFALFLAGVAAIAAGLNAWAEKRVPVTVATVQAKASVQTAYEGDEDENEDVRIVNINTASAEQLRTLPGIGAEKAQSIVEYRTQNGLFSKTEDIMQVSGIGEKLFEKIKDIIVV